MFSASQLTGEQKETIHEWVAEGAQMSDVQKRLKEEFDFTVTYMDTRFLSLDLDLQFIKEEEPEPEPEVEAEIPSGEEEPLPPHDGVARMPPPGGFQPVTVSLDQLARPGAMVSGKVTFSDGENGMWMIDQEGRPSVDPDTAGYRPSQEDLAVFQEELRKLLDSQA
jgi:hypothetical protein